MTISSVPEANRNEQPRWLVMKGRKDEAIRVLAKYHAEGDADAPIVQLQIREIVDDMKDRRNDNPWWDFKELVYTRAARYRLAMVIGKKLRLSRLTWTMWWPRGVSYAQSLSETLCPTLRV